MFCSAAWTRAHRATSSLIVTVTLCVFLDTNLV